MKISKRLQQSQRHLKQRLSRLQNATSELNFIRVGCPTSTIIHVPLSVAKLNKSARNDMSKSALSLHEVIDTSYIHPKTTRDISPDIVASINSLKFPREKILKECRLQGRYFSLSPIEPNRHEEIEWSVKNDIKHKRRAPVRTQLMDHMEKSEYAKLQRDFEEVERLGSAPRRKMNKLMADATYIAFSQPESLEFFKAVKASNLALLRHMLSLSPNLINTVDFVGQTAMHWAAKRNDLKLGDLLISHKAKVDPKDLTDRTPLSIALRLDKPEIVKFLLENGADPTICLKSRRAFRASKPETQSMEQLSLHMKRLNRRRLSRVRKS